MSESVTKDAEQAAAEDLLWRVHRNGVERLNAQMLQEIHGIDRWRMWGTCAFHCWMRR